MNHSLASLPGLIDAPRPRSMAEAAERLEERRHAALRVAESTAALAEVMAKRGDHEAARELVAEAQLYLEEMRVIGAMRA